MSQLLPEGIDHLGDAPYTLHNAILIALRILDYEGLPTEERPPKRIWLDNEKLNKHWKQVEATRRKKYGIKGDEDTDEDDEPMTDNAVELVKRGR